MKYIIQLFKTPAGDDWKRGEPFVGYWCDTNWGGYDRDKVMQNCQRILDTGKFAGVRVVEVLWTQWKTKPEDDIRGYAEIEEVKDFKCGICGRNYDEPCGTVYCASQHGICGVCDMPRSACKCQTSQVM